MTWPVQSICMWPKPKSAFRKNMFLFFCLDPPGSMVSGSPFLRVVPRWSPPRSTRHECQFTLHAPDMHVAY